MRQIVVLRFGFGLLLLLESGCGVSGTDYGQVLLVEVEGRVTLDGQPLAGAVVTFEDADGQFSYGLTDSSGRYKLRFDSVVYGVVPGPKTVRIGTRRTIVGLNSAEGDAEEEAGPQSGAPVERVPAKYNAKSELTVEVSPNQREHDFDLKSA